MDDQLDYPICEALWCSDTPSHNIGEVCGAPAEYLVEGVGRPLPVCDYHCRLITENYKNIIFTITSRAITPHAEVGDELD